MNFSFEVIYVLIVLVVAVYSNESTISLNLTSTHLSERIIENSRVFVTCVATKTTESNESEESDDSSDWEDIEVIIRHNGSETVSQNDHSIPKCTVLE